jgi:hypothetical protein
VRLERHHKISRHSICTGLDLHLPEILVQGLPLQKMLRDLAEIVGSVVHYPCPLLEVFAYCFFELRYRVPYGRLPEDVFVDRYTNEGTQHSCNSNRILLCGIQQVQHSVTLIGAAEVERIRFFELQAGILYEMRDIGMQVYVLLLVLEEISTSQVHQRVAR